jgi:hypothetical protein
LRQSLLPIFELHLGFGTGVLFRILQVPTVGNKAAFFYGNDVGQDYFFETCDLQVQERLQRVEGHLSKIGMEQNFFDLHERLLLKKENQGCDDKTRDKKNQ